MWLGVPNIWEMVQSVSTCRYYVFGIRASHSTPASMVQERTRADVCMWCTILVCTEWVCVCWDYSTLEWRGVGNVERED